jgi:hypothetical protein
MKMLYVGALRGDQIVLVPELLYKRRFSLVREGGARQEDLRTHESSLVVFRQSKLQIAQ